MAKAATAAPAQGSIAIPEMVMPATFNVPDEPMKARFIAPYIVFAHPKRKDEWDRIVAKYGRVQEGDLFLVEQATVTELSKCKVGWLTGKQYWALANGAGEVQRTSYEEMPKPWKEHIEAVLYVYLEDRIVVVNANFRSTKCGAAKKMSDALIEANSPKWADNSEAHKLTLALKSAHQRFFATLSVLDPRKGKDSGLAYRPCAADISPTTAVEWVLLKKFMEDPNSAKAMKDAEDRYKSRLAEVASKLDK